MAVLNSGTIIAVAEETVLGGGKVAAWVDADVISCQDDSGLTPAIESLERTNFNGSFIKCPAVAGQESTSGSINMELTLDASDKLGGHLIFKSGLGKYIADAADISVANKISEKADPIATPTGSGLYRLSRPTEARTTLAIREHIGGTQSVIDSKGCVVDSISFDFSAGQLVKASTSLSGIAFANLEGITPLNSLGCVSAQAFVTKSAKFIVDGVALAASGVTLEISNEVSERNYISSNGVGNKVIVGKGVTLNYTLDFVNTNELTKMKNNTKAEIFIELINSAGDKVSIYLPVVSYSSVELGNDGGVKTLSISSMAYNDAEDNCLYIATTKAP